MSDWLQAFAEHQPITIAANALRGLTLGPGALPAGHTVAGRSSRCCRRGLDQCGGRGVDLGLGGPPAE